MGSMARRDGEIGLNQYRTPGVATPKGCSICSAPMHTSISIWIPATAPVGAFLRTRPQKLVDVSVEASFAALCGQTRRQGSSRRW